MSDTTKETKNCSKCQQSSSRFCKGCDLYYCISCCDQRHRKGSFLRHEIVGGNGSLCDECNKNAVVLKCWACELQLCHACSEEVHKSGTMQNHVKDGKLYYYNSDKTGTNEIAMIGTGLAEALSGNSSAFTSACSKPTKGTLSCSPWSNSWNAFSADGTSKFSQWLPAPRVDSRHPRTVIEGSSITERYKSLTSLPAVQVTAEQNRPFEKAWKPTTPRRDTEEIFRILSVEGLPSRNIVIRLQLPLQVSAEDMYNTLKTFGDIEYFNSDLSPLGFFFLAYFDLATAVNVHQHVKTIGIQNCGAVPLLRSDMLSASFSIPFKGAHNGQCENGSFALAVPSPTIPVNQIQQFCAQWGAIARVQRIESSACTFMIEFSDTRAAEKAIREINGVVHWGGKLQTYATPVISREEKDRMSMFLRLVTELQSIGVLTKSPVGKAAQAGPSKVPVEQNTANLNEADLSPWTLYVGAGNRTRSVHPIPVPISAKVVANPNLSSQPAVQSRSASFSSGISKRQGNRVSDGKNSTGRNDQGSGEFCLNIENVKNGLDKRTTLMVRNIPNKYTQHMLLAEINEKHKELYDFFYLPIDFKNKCNMGYAFINFIDYPSILPFYKEFSNQKWRNFNSEKVCAISYARLQGKASMIARFQNSSLLDKDESYRPLVFSSSGTNKGKPEPFPVGKLSRSTDEREHTTRNGHGSGKSTRSGFPQMVDLERNLPNKVQPT